MEAIDLETRRDCVADAEQHEHEGDMFLLTRWVAKRGRGEENVSCSEIQDALG